MHGGAGKHQATEGSNPLLRFTLFLLLLAGAIACAIGLQTIGSSEVKPALQLKNELFIVDVVDTEAERAQGLSGRDHLKKQNGMLFVFDEPGAQCFWMKDMNFAIDIIWLNAGRQINHIEKSVLPDTYPTSFCPDSEAQYVVELPAGTAEELGLRKGDSATLTL